MEVVNKAGLLIQINYCTLLHAYGRVKKCSDTPLDLPLELNPIKHNMFVLSNRCKYFV